MNYRDALLKEKHWQRRVIIITLYHNAMKLRRSNWSQRLTAKRLGISLGSVCESLKLSHAIVDNPELENLTRDEALQAMRCNP